MEAHAPTYNAYFRLMRLHQPAGIWLLMWPCWWAAALASAGYPPPVTLLLFFLGAYLMRPAGCIINDLADRKLDSQVDRTKDRPLVTGEVTPGEAVRLLLWLLMLAFLVAWALGEPVIYWSLAALPLVVLYPFMKRITWWPQLFLGLTFNWGALVGWAAVTGTVEFPAVLLYLGGIFWTLGYDTIYAHQDKEDDARAGVKSTALLLGKDTKSALFVFYTAATGFWAAAGYRMDAGALYNALLFMAWLQLMWQIRTVRLDDPASCNQVFVSNKFLGLLLFAACALKGL